jgi:hypothetical protein
VVAVHQQSRGTSGSPRVHAELRAVILDLSSRRVVGWSMSERIDRHRVLNALDMALRGRQPQHGLLHDSDRGSQYASEDSQQLLEAQGIQCSMSRKGHCWDNAVAESIFSSLKMGLVHEADFATHEQARAALFEYIEVFYNRKRRHSSLGYVSPVLQWHFRAHLLGVEGHLGSQAGLAAPLRLREPVLGDVQLPPPQVLSRRRRQQRLGVAAGRFMGFAPAEVPARGAARPGASLGCAVRRRQHALKIENSLRCADCCWGGHRQAILPTRHSSP